MRPEDLIEGLEEWNDGKGIDIDGYLAGSGNFNDAIAYANLFWPEFIERNGCIFRRDVPQEAIDHWLEHTRGDLSAVEAMLNHEHIVHLFTTVQPQMPEQLAYLARILQETWQAKLARDFPQRQIVVEAHDGSVDDLTGYQVTFYQRR